MDSQSRQGLLLIIMAGLGYAFLPTITRLIYANSALTPTDIGIWRFIFATPVIWLVLAGRNRGQTPLFALPLPFWKLFLLGFLYAVAAVSAFAGLQYISASVYIVLFFTYPALVAVISLFLGERFTMTTWLALVLTIIGIALTIGDFNLLEGSNVPLGIVIAMINALSVAIYFILMGRMARGVTAMTQLSTWVITCTLFNLLLTIPIYGLTLPPNLATWGLLLALASVSTAMPIAVLNMGIQKLGVARASIVSATEPVMAMVLAILILGESVGIAQWIGAVFIIAAVMMIELRPRRRKSSLNG